MLRLIAYNQLIKIENIIKMDISTWGHNDENQVVIILSVSEEALMYPPRRLAGSPKGDLKERDCRGRIAPNRTLRSDRDLSGRPGDLVGGKPHGTLFDVGRNFALAGFMIPVMQFLLAARVKWIERAFGLDILIRYHKYTAVTAVCFLLLHPILIDALRDMGVADKQIRREQHLDHETLYLAHVRNHSHEKSDD